jgi:hypothetical protein
MFLVSVAIVFYAFAKRQWLKYLRHQAVEGASELVGNAQTFDSAASASIVFIQEVELVSRGYRMSVYSASQARVSDSLTPTRSTPLPPISRLEEHTQSRRCLRLRRALFECLTAMLQRYLQAQQNLRRLADTNDLEKYYDIYDVSPAELRDAETSPELGAEDSYSLRSLRNIFTRFYTVRKSILCCLLSLGADGEESDITRWSTAIEEMRNIVSITATYTKRLADILNEQDRKCTKKFRSC